MLALALASAAFATPRFPTPEQRVRWADAVVVFRTKRQPSGHGEPFPVVVEEALKGAVAKGEIQVRCEPPQPVPACAQSACWTGAERGILYLRREKEELRVLDFVDFDSDFGPGPEEQPRIRDTKGAIRFFAELEAVDGDPEAAVRAWLRALDGDNASLVELLLFRTTPGWGFEDDEGLQAIQRRQREAGREPLLAKAMSMARSHGAVAVQAVRALAREADREPALEVARAALGMEGGTAAAGLELAADLDGALARDTALAWIAARGDVGTALRALETVARAESADLKRVVGPLVALLDREEHRRAARRVLEIVVGNPGLSVPEWKQWWAMSREHYER
jgi:hypothetical protein